jgi:hypothetical protein
MGPGLLIKSILQGSFSLMVFGWAQIIMDIQPLIVILSQQGHLHGFSHTYLGATLLALFATLSGKYLAEIGLKLLKISDNEHLIKITWWVALMSAFIGTFTHVFLDSIMHGDVEPFYPFSNANGLLGIINISQLHHFCLYSGLMGTGLYFVLHYYSCKIAKKKMLSIIKKS